MRLSVMALLCFTAAQLPSQTIRYEPGSGRYEQIISISSPQTGAATGGMSADLRTRLVLSTSIARLGAGDSLRLTVTVDSSTVTGGGALARGGPLAPVGTKVERRMTPWGKSSADASEVRSAGQLVAAILPVLANGARLGSAWEDTMPVDLLGGGGSMRGLSGQLARSFLVTKDTTYEGESAWKIDIGSKTTVAGSVTTELPIKVDGGGDGTGVIYLSKKGVLLYSNESQVLQLNVRLQEGAAPITIETNTVRTVRRLK